ncbi:MAG: ACT domain-containing protein [Nanoarchaeota archaeon]|nr:ACT domain-containing protein [Nanoarchaeota archaeon]
MELEDYFKNGKVYIWKEKFAIINSKKPMPDSFALIQDKENITVIIDQSKIKEEDIIGIEKDFKILTFDMTIDFGLVGFSAKVSKALADKKVSSFIISAYSTDHILVKEKDLEKTKKALEELGCVMG